LPINPPIDVWWVAVSADGIEYRAYLGGVVALEGRADYDGGGRRQATPLRMMTGAGPTMMHVASDDGGGTDVCGRSRRSPQ
jgi:hypothetical protein